MSASTATVEGDQNNPSEGPARVNHFLDPDGAPQADPAGRTKEAPLPDANVAITEAKTSRVIKWPTLFAWIPKNLSWPHAKDIFRCTTTAWISLILILIQPVIIELGIVSRYFCTPLCARSTCPGKLPYPHCCVPLSSSRAFRRCLRTRDTHPAMRECRLGVR
jgi:hypothetical protein